MFVLCMTGVREGRAVCSLREFAMTLPPVLVLDFCPGRRRPKAAKNGEAGGGTRALGAGVLGAAREQFTQNKLALKERIFGDAYAFI